MTRRTLLQAAACAAVAAMPSALWAASYASELSLSGGNVNFRLNEAADDVKVILDGTTTLSFGPQAAGPVSLSLGGATPSSYQIVVGKTSGAGFVTGADNVANVLQTSQDSNPLLQYEWGNSLALNTNPASPYFGQLYIASGRLGTTVTGRTTEDGLYALKADLTDAYGFGTTAKTGGLDFGTGGTASPYRITIGEDDHIYIADWADSTGSVYRMTQDLADTSGQQVLQGQGYAAEPPEGINHGSIAGVVAIGSTATGNLTLYVIDEDRGQDTTENSLWRHELGAGPLPANPVPTHLLTPSINFVSQTMDVARSPDGHLYVTNRRDVGTETGLWVANDAGTLALSSLRTSREIANDPGQVDFMNQSIGVSASPTRNYIAIGRVDGFTYVVPTLAGIPDLANRHLLPNFTSFNKDVDFDAAGNLYTVSNADEVVRVFSPGDFSFTVTGSSGTFTASPTWTADSGGSFGDTTKWLVGVAPNGANHSATFGATTAAASVSVDAPTTVTRLILDNASGYTFSGGSTLTFDGFGPNVFADAGSHTIATPVHLAKSTGFSVANAADTLTVSGAVTTGANVGIVKGGAGTVQFTGAMDMSNVNWVASYGGTLKVGSIAGPGGAVQARVHVGPGATLEATGLRATVLRLDGTVNIAPNGGPDGTVIVNRVGAHVATGITGLIVGTAGKLNLNDNDLLINHDADGEALEASTRQLVIDGRATGATRGIFSTRGTPDDKVLAVANNEEWNKTTYNGFNIDPTTIVGKYTYLGDSNLDGAVTGDDYLAVDSNLGIGDDWIEGDFNMDLQVTGDDYLAIDTNLGKGTPNPLAFAELKAEMIALHVEMFGEEYLAKLADVEANGFQVVPEPGALSLVGLGAIGLLSRRRRRA